MRHQHICPMFYNLWGQYPVCFFPPIVFDQVVPELFSNFWSWDHSGDWWYLLLEHVSGLNFFIIFYAILLRIAECTVGNIHIMLTSIHDQSTCLWRMFSVLNTGTLNSRNSTFQGTEFSTLQFFFLSYVKKKKDV